MAAVGLTSAARPRVVVLGASNVSRGLSRLLAAVAASQGDADLFVAAGHGRSYGVNSRVWMRRLPSILHCGLWRALDRGTVTADGLATPPLHALLTDVGNDLLYGFAVEQVAAWVRECVARLAQRGARVAITRLPLPSVAAVGPIRYRALRTLFVPGCRLSLEELKDAALRLDGHLVAIAAEHGALVIDQPGGWYGLDPIHIRRRHLAALWRRAGEAWGLDRPAGRGRPRSPARWAMAGIRGAEVRSLAGWMRFTRQPVLRLPGGGTLSLY